MMVFHGRKPSDGSQLEACPGYGMHRLQIAFTFGSSCCARANQMHGHPQDSLLWGKGAYPLKQPVRACM